MGKKKNAPVASAAAAAAESKAIENLKTLNAKLLKEAHDQRKQMEQLQLQLQLASSKKNAPASPACPVSAAAGRIKVMDNMKTLNTKLTKEVEELCKQTEQLRFKIDSFSAERNNLSGIEREVLGLVLSSTIGEAAARKTAEMAATNSELDAAEMRKLALIREKDAIRRDLERRVEQRDSCVRSLEKAEGTRRTWKKWLYSFAAAAVCAATTTLLAGIFCGKGSRLEN